MLYNNRLQLAASNLARSVAAEGHRTHHARADVHSPGPPRPSKPEPSLHPPDEARRACEVDPGERVRRPKDLLGQQLLVGPVARRTVGPKIEAEVVEVEHGRVLGAQALVSTPRVVGRARHHPGANGIEAHVGHTAQEVGSGRGGWGTSPVLPGRAG